MPTLAVRETGWVTVEIERKFLVSRLPADLPGGPPRSLRQGYVAEDGDVAVRVRVEDGDATLTIKAGAGRRRTEVEVSITPAQAEALWPHTAGRSLSKHRRAVPLDGRHAGLVVDLDVYDGDLAGLITAEVEFDDDETAARFEPPEWFGREVTGETAWTNAALARHGRPPEPV